jgi:hypothetical protein
VRELARVATPQTEREWVEAARGRTVHEVERLVSGQKRGARPTDEAEPAQQRQVLRFDVSAETLATFREAMMVLRQRSDASLDDDSALLLMAREVLGGPADDGRSSYQISLNICERCGRGSQDSRGEVVPVDDAIVAMAQCDAQHVGRVSSQSLHVSALHAAGETHVGANEIANEPDSSKPPRATQAVPPALRRKVLRRDHRRCVVPGCRNATFVDLHHVEARADGGADDADNLVVLCSVHHRALHRGQLAIHGRVSNGLVFERGDGRAYGALDSPRAADACERVFRGLRGLGFGEREARRAIERVRGVGDTATLLRRALSLLTEQAMHP